MRLSRLTSTPKKPRAPRAKAVPKGTAIPKPLSELEEMMELQIRAIGLPQPVAQLMFAKSIKRKWLFDFSWPEIMFAVEVQGGQWRRKGAHNTGTAMNRDCEKLANAVIMGWTVLQVTGDQVRNGQAIEWVEKVFFMRAAQ